MLGIQIAILASDEPFGICPNIIDLTDHQKDVLVTGALKCGNEEIREYVIEKMLIDNKLADALDARMYGLSAEEILEDIRNNLYIACESLIQDAIDMYNDEVRERDAEPARPNSDFY
jgi:hypothetical protein